MRRLRGALLGAVLLITGLVPVAAPQVACAATGPHAALVVETGGAVQDFCVALPDDSVSGIELIQLAGQQFGLDYKLGYGGGAVCMLAGVGPTGGDCFAEYPDFWGYWHGGPEGSWTWAGSGASSSTVTSGDVEGWSWGSGDDGSSHPPPPATRLDAVCAISEPNTGEGDGHARDEDESSPQDDEGVATEPPGREAPRRPGADTEAQGQSPRNDGGRSKGKRRAQEPTTPSPTASPIPESSPTLAASSVDAAEEPPGPPIVGLAGLGAAIVLGAAGAVVARRRRAKP